MDETQKLVLPDTSKAEKQILYLNLETVDQDNQTQQSEDKQESTKVAVICSKIATLCQRRQNLMVDQTPEQSKADLKKIESIYRRMIFLRRITRVLMLITIIGLLIGFFVKGYLITVEKSNWSSNQEIQNIKIYVQNCFVNIMESDDLLQFNYHIKGNLINQIDSFTIKGEIIAQSTANLTFNSPFEEIRNCLIDLLLPKNIQNLFIICQTKSTCVMAFGMEQIILKEEFSAKSEDQASLSVNIKNIKTKKFAYFSEQSGNLFINNFEIEQANIQQSGGIISLQSIKSFYLNYSSQSHAICSSAYKITDQINDNCYFKSEDQQFLSQICQGSMNLCQKDSCESQNQIINIIGNQSLIYANILIDIGKPLIKGINQFDIIQSYPFLLGNLSLSQDSKQKIQSFLNEANEADIGVRIDVSGHYLLQNSYSTQWVFFSNPQYGAFKPWWLSVVSASFLNPLFTHIQVNLEPGFCPWNPSLTSEQLFNIKNTIQEAFNTSYGQTVFIQRDDYIQQNKTLNENLTYNGFEPLKEKQKGQLEDWYVLKQQEKQIQYTSLYYNPYFIVAIGLSILSAIIFGLFLLKFGLYDILIYLRGRALKQSKQFYRYALNISQCNTKKQQNSNNEIEQVNDNDFPPFLGILSYIFYELGQLYFKDALLSFKHIFYKKGSQEYFYFNSSNLSEKLIAIDVDELKELYEQFCFMNKLKIKPLNDRFQDFGFRFVEKENSIILTKIKLNPNANTYDQLTAIEKLHSQNSLQLFFSTQCCLTGIQQDEISAQLLEEKYIEFCGNQLKVEKFDVQEICYKYGLKISDKRLLELRNQEYCDQQQSIYHNLLSFQNATDIYKINRLSNLKAFQLNPIEELYEKYKNNQLNYDSLFKMFYYSLNRKLPSFKRSFFWRQNNYEKLTSDNDNQNIIDYFDAIYIEDWIISDAIVVIGNLIILTFFNVPYLFFLVLMNTSYSPYSIYNPKSMLTKEDMIYRAWIFIDYVPYFDDWVIGIIQLLLFYQLISFSFQIQKYAFSYFPNEIEYIWELKMQKKQAVLRHLNGFWLVLFVFLALGFFVYFGLIIVWLLLGAIINPNQYLVYSSSALSFVSFIYTEVAQVQEIYQQACLQINNIIKDILSQLFSQTVAPIIKEIQRLSDQSIQIINSSIMDEAKTIASIFGFEEELQELCVSTQAMLEDVACTDINQEKINFKQIKDKFLQKAESNFIKMAKDQFNIPEIMAELFVKINITKFEDVYEILAQQISLATKNKVPASIFLWIQKIQLNYDPKNTNQISADDSLVNINYLLDLLIDQSLDNSRLDQQLDKKDEYSDQTSKVIFLKRLLNLIYQFPKNQKNEQQNINDNQQNFKIKIELVKKFFENIKDISEITEKLDSTQINALIQVLNFILSCMNDDFETRESKTRGLIENMLDIYQLDKDILKFIELLYSKMDYFITEDNTLQVITDEYSVVNTIIHQYFQKFIKNIEYPNNFTVILVALRSIQRNIPNFTELFQFITKEIKWGKKIDHKQSHQSFLQKQEEKFHFSYLLLQFTLKDWQIELETESLGQNQQFFLEILPVSCKTLWSSKFLLEQENDQNQKKISRKKYLKNNTLVKSIALGLNISEDSTIGLILILRAEIFSSIYHNAIYQTLFQYPQLNKSCKKIGKLISLLSIVNFENVFNFLLIHFSEQFQIIECFLELVFSSRIMFEIFNGFSIIKKIYEEDEIILRYIRRNILKHLINELFQDKNKGQSNIFNIQTSQKKNQVGPNQSYFEQFTQSSQFKEELNTKNLEVLKYFQQNRVTFYSFLNQEYINQKNLQNKKSDFYQLINDNISLEECGLEIILQHQQYLLQNNDLNQEQIINIQQVQGLNNQSYKHLLQLMQFHKLSSVIEALRFFQQFDSQKNISTVVSQQKQKLQKLIELEQAIFQFQQSNIFPYQLNSLQNLIINQVFQTQINLNSSNFLNIINYFAQKMDQILNIHSEEINDQQTSELEIQTIKNKNIEILFGFSERILQIIPQIESHSQQLGLRQLSNLLSEFSGSYNRGQFMSLIYSFSNMKNKKYSKIFLKLHDLIQIKISDLCLRKFLNDFIQTIQNLITIKSQQVEADYLKYIFSSDLESFAQLIQQFIQKQVTRKEDQCNINIIISIFSILTEKPNYLILKTNFNLEQEQIKLAKFIVNVISSRKKTKLIDQYQSTIQLYFGKSSVNHLIWLQQILEYDSIDPNNLFKALNLDQNTQVKVFEQFYYLKRQINYQKKWSDMQQQYNQLADKRLQKVYKESEYYSKINPVGNIPQILIFEMLNWFSHPRPTSFIFLNGKFNLLDEKTAILFSIIGSIGKYDWTDTYQSVDAEKIHLKAKGLSQLINKTLQDKLTYVIKTSDCNLEETFLLLYVLTGINPSITCAIFQNSLNENQLHKIILSEYLDSNQQLFSEFVNVLQTIEQKFQLSDVLSLINYEAQNSQKIIQQSNCFANIPISQDDYATIKAFIMQLNQEEKVQNFPFSSLALIYGLKFIRAIKKENNFLIEKQKIGQFLMDFVITIFEITLPIDDSFRIFLTQNKDHLLKLLNLGIFDSHKLRQSLKTKSSQSLISLSGQQIENDFKFFQIFDEQIQDKESQQYKNYDVLKIWSDKKNLLSFIYQVKEKNQNQQSKQQLSNLFESLIDLDFQQIGYIKSKYWIKSIDLLKQQKLNHQKYEIKQSPQQQLFVDLLQYYARNVPLKVSQVKVDPIKLIEKIMQVNSQQNQIQELQLINKIFYDSDNIKLEQLNKIWEDDQIIMESILIMQLRKDYNNFKRRGKYSRLIQMKSNKYFSQFQEDYYGEQFKPDFQKIQEKINLGIEKLIDQCQKIKNKVLYKQVINQLIRTYLGEIDAWYEICFDINKQEQIITQNKVDNNNQLMQIFIRDFLKQIMKLKLKNQFELAKKIKYRSFYQLIKYLENGKNVFFKAIKQSLSNTLYSSGYKIQGNFMEELIKFIEFILKQSCRKSLNYSDQNCKTIYIIDIIYEFRKTNETQIKLQKAIQFLLHLFFDQDKLIENDEEVLNCVILQMLSPNDTIDKTDQDKCKQIIKMILELQQPCALQKFSKNTAKLLELHNIEQQLKQNDQFQELFKIFLNQLDDSVNKQNQINNLGLLLFFVKLLEQERNMPFIQQNIENKLRKLTSKESSSLNKIQKIVEFFLYLIFLDQNQEQLDLLDVFLLKMNQIFEMYEKNKFSPDFDQFIGNILQLENRFLNTILTIYIKQQKLDIDTMQSVINQVQDLEQLINYMNHFPKSQEKIPIIIGKLLESQDIKIIEKILNKQPLIEKLFSQLQNPKMFSKQEFVNIIKEISKNILKDETLLIICINTFLALKNQDFEQIPLQFFQKIFNKTMQESEIFLKHILDFQKGLQVPQLLIKERLQSLSNQNNIKARQIMNPIISKLNENRELTIDDMFRVLDRNAQRFVKSNDILEFLRRLGIEITQHKFREILVVVKQGQFDINNCLIDFYEFKLIMEEIQEIIISQCLQELGISKSDLIAGLVWFIFYMIIVLVFILIGVQAFAAPGTLAVLVNSALPILGALSLNKLGLEKQFKIPDFKAFVEVVRKILLSNQPRKSPNQQIRD